MQRYIILFSLFGGILMDNAKSREINVIEFQPDYTGPNGNSGNTQQGGQLTKKLTGCFRFMPRYHRNLYVFDNQDFWMTLSGEKNGFIGTSNQANETAPKEDYWRLFSLCKPRIPGIWTSICLSIVFSESTQQVRLYQNGKMCSNRVYIDGNFGSINYKTDGQMANW